MYITHKYYLHVVWTGSLKIVPFKDMVEHQNLQEMRFKPQFFKQPALQGL